MSKGNKETKRLYNVEYYRKARLDPEYRMVHAAKQRLNRARRRGVELDACTCAVCGAAFKRHLDQTTKKTCTRACSYVLTVRTRTANKGAQ